MISVSSYGKSFSLFYFMSDFQYLLGVTEYLNMSLFIVTNFDLNSVYLAISENLLTHG
jgi:hypothetical protein